MFGTLDDVNGQEAPTVYLFSLSEGENLIVSVFIKSPKLPCAW